MALSGQVRSFATVSYAAGPARYSQSGGPPCSGRNFNDSYLIDMPFDLAASYIAAAEREIGATLPASYVTAMQTSNGSELDVLDDDWQQYPIADTSDRKRLSRTTNHVIKETEVLFQSPRFPKDGLVIAGNGSGDQMVLLRDGDVFAESVYHWSHETGALTKIANAFSELAVS